MYQLDQSSRPLSDYFLKHLIILDDQSYLELCVYGYHCSDLVCHWMDLFATDIDSLAFANLLCIQVVGCSAIFVSVTTLEASSHSQMKLFQQYCTMFTWLKGSNGTSMTVDLHDSRWHFIQMKWLASGCQHSSSAICAYLCLLILS